MGVKCVVKISKYYYGNMILPDEDKNKMSAHYKKRHKIHHIFELYRILNVTQ